MSLMDPVATLVDDFNVGPLIVDRRAAKTQNPNTGRFDIGALASFTLDPVAAYPVTGRDLLQMPEAYRNSEVIQFVARDGSFPGGIVKGFRVSDKGKDPDVITYNGRRYVLISAPDYSIQGKVLCATGVLEDLQAQP
jgi:hypothetical protein